MLLMGDRNWYMPRWLDRITPHMSIEGAEYFRTDEQLRVIERERERERARELVP
jgi:RND superfamily putative drug exporter